MVDKFAHKDPDDFFQSERRFLEPLAPTLRTVLDVGCASGRLVTLLESLGATDLAYTGVDLVASSIENGRAAFPSHRFVLGDAIEIDLGPPRHHDLVNATGVFQHEPRTTELLATMLDASRRHVLFDCKLRRGLGAHLCDQDRSHVDIGDERLYFIVHDVDLLLDQITADRRVTAVEVFAYPAAPNQRTTVPEEVLPFQAAGVFVTLGDGERSGDPTITVDGPPELSA